MLKKIITSTLYLGIVVILGCMTGSKHSSCETNCYYTKKNCHDQCNANSISISFDLKEPGTIYSCPEKCENHYKNCLVSCKQAEE